jgi:hypothetical protein
MEISMAEVEDTAEPEPPPVPPIAKAWRYVRPGLEVAALYAAYRQYEGLAVAAKALAVLGQSAVDRLVATNR